MKRLQFSLRTLFVVTAVVGLCMAIGVLLAQPPWHNKASFYVHRLLIYATGWELHSLDDYTGTARFWDSAGRLQLRCEYIAGHRHGRWIEYDESGAVRSECVYRNDEPWHGMCQLSANKLWIGEYKNGKPWNGCLPVLDSATGQTAWKCYMDGQVIPEDQYKRRQGIDSNATLIGLHYMED